MAREIIQMYDKYHSTKKVYPKVVEECLPEDYQGLPDDIEDLETELGDKSTVTANPELAGTEDSLEGIEIDGTKYKVCGGGKQLYLHLVQIADYTHKINANITIINDSSTTLNTGQKLYNYLYGKGINGSPSLACTGKYGDNHLGIRNICGASDNHLWFGLIDVSNSFDLAYSLLEGVSDLVITL